MKKILSTVLALCMILGCVAVGFTAQAATEADLQNGINNAIANGTDYTWTGQNINLTQPLTINGDVKVDFKGATVKGPSQKNTIIINSGNVELCNADIEGISGLGFIDEVVNAHPTVNIGNATVTLTDLIVTGAYIKLPGVNESVPLSDAISIWGANGVVNLHNVRAFGNIGVDNKRGSKVNVVDCLIGGYLGDFGDKDNVFYADNTTQYSMMELFCEALADHIVLTPGEEELLTNFFGNVLKVTASVKNQNYVKPTYDYNADTDTLKVIATADKSYDTKVKCAFDYFYVPKTATIRGETKEFVKTGDLTYTATFENIPGGTKCDADLLYKIGVDMGGDAQAMVDQLIAKIEGFINGIPALITKVDEKINDAIDTYLTGEQGFATILWNAYNQPGLLEGLLNGYSAEEQEKAKADIKAMLGPVFDLCGVELKYRSNTSSAEWAAITAVRNGSASTGQYSKIQNFTTQINGTYGSALNTADNAGKDLGKGLIARFLDYWTTVRDLAVEDGHFKNLQELGEYLGANYSSIYNDYVMGSFKPCLDRVIELLSDENNFVISLAANAGLDLSTIGGLSNSVENAFAMLDAAYNHPAVTGIANKYGDLVPQLCGQYLEKAYTIATNLDVYLDIETDGNLIEGYEFLQTDSYTTPIDANARKVTVNLFGYGKYAVAGDVDKEGKQIVNTATQEYYVPMGSSFKVEPVEFGTEKLFSYYAICDKVTEDANARLSPTGGELTVYSDTIITLFFASLPGDNETQTYDVVFMTNYELSSTWIDTLKAGEIDEIPAPFVFEGLEFLGWSTRNISGADAEEAGILISSDALLELANNVEKNTTFYAIYKSAKKTVDSELLNNYAVFMSDSFVSEHMAYFTVLISDRPLAEGDVIVEAGVLAAASQTTINGATPNGGSGIVKGNLILADYDLPAAYTFGVYSKDHSTTKNVYAKGFVTVRHADGTYDTEYTAIYSQVLEGYEDPETI